MKIKPYTVSSRLTCPTWSFLERNEHHEASALGLYGVDAVLSEKITGQCLEHTAEALTLKQFLDVFHSRFYPLLKSVLGQNNIGLRKKAYHRFHQANFKQGQQGVLPSNTLASLSFRLQQTLGLSHPPTFCFHPEWVRLSRVPTLGEAQLSQDAVLGKRLQHQHCLMAHIHVTEAEQGCLNDLVAWRQAVFSFIGGCLDFSMDFLVTLHTPAKQVILCAEKTSLGVTTCLGKKTEHKGSASVIIYP